MNKIIFILVMVACGDSLAIESDFFVKVGAGYKVDQQQAFEASPLSARIDAGFDNVLVDGLSMGVSHHSQWMTGFPFNEDKEVFKTEVFIDYTWRWGL